LWHDGWKPEYWKRNRHPLLSKGAVTMWQWIAEPEMAIAR
jgi:hypothetical protein